MLRTDGPAQCFMKGGALRESERPCVLGGTQLHEDGEITGEFESSGHLVALTAALVRALKGYVDSDAPPRVPQIDTLYLW